MSAININKNNFQNEIMDSEKTVLLDFWAPWCAPCRMVVPVIEEIAGERPDIKVGKINVDEQPELASEFGVMSIPTLVVMKNGKIVQRVSGARPKEAILEIIFIDINCSHFIILPIISLWLYYNLIFISFL